MSFRFSIAFFSLVLSTAALTGSCKRSGEAVGKGPPDHAGSGTIHPKPLKADSELVPGGVVSKVPAEKDPVARMEEATSEAQLGAFYLERCKRGVLNKAELGDLGIALDRVARLFGKELSQVTAEFLRALGKAAQTSANDLCTALADSPDDLIVGVRKALVGREKQMVMALCLSRFARDGNVGAMEKIYKRLEPGIDRTLAADAYTRAAIVQGDARDGLKLIGSFEYPEERRLAVMGVALELKDHPELVTDGVLLKELYETAKRENNGEFILMTFPELRQAEGSH